MKNVVVVHVTDFAHRIPHDVDVIEFCFARDFSADDHDVALGIRLAGDAAFLIYRETRIENGIGNSIANFVRVTFTHGFGSKDKTAEHAKEI